MIDIVFPQQLQRWKQPENTTGLNPSDHLDAWVAMRLGRLWLESQLVKIYGNCDIGSFLLPAQPVDDADSEILRAIRDVAPT